jgi:uncharacterized membrane protein YfcA
MQIYLPIAGMPVDIILLLLLGIATGILSGMFGVGGGFLMTPILIFMGIPPAIAVSSSANQVVASSLSGFMAHWQRKNVDFKMGLMLLIGGFFGSGLGVVIFHSLQRSGMINLAISLSYVFILGTIGLLMLIEAIRSIANKRKNIVITKAYEASKLQKMDLPLKIYFHRSKVEMSAIVPIVIGLVAGILVSIMGIGGGFIMVPAMIYLLKVPTQIAVGTSLFQIIFTSSIVTFLQALTNNTIDIVLTLLMLAGSVTGAQLGTRMAVKIPAENLRGMLAIMMLILVIRLGYGLFIEPENLFEISMLEEIR